MEAKFEIEPIETQRLILRPVQLRDAQDLFSYASVESNIEYVTFPIHKNIEDTLEVIEKLFLTRPTRNQFSTLAIILKETNQFIGTIDFTKYGQDKAELGYILHRDYWNHGYVKEAGRVVLDYGFKHGIRKFICRHHPDNIGSQKVMLSFGFVLEGIQRQESFFPNIKEPGYIDIPIYSLLKEDFYE